MSMNPNLSTFDREMTYILHPAARVEHTFGLGFRLDPVQEQIIKDQSDRIIVCCSRQWGKTTTVAAKAAAEALSYPGLYLVIAPTERQAKELFRRTKDYICHAYPSMKFEEANKTSLELPNRSRIVALPAKGENIRGYPNPRLVIIDEAAFVKDQDYRAIRPFLSHGGKLIILSTPFGKRGFFHNTWIKQDPGWSRYSVTADECYHISREFLDEERMTLGEAWYAQEYECKFIDSVLGFFNMDKVRAGLDEGIEPLFPVRDKKKLNEDDSIQPLFGGKT